MESLPLPYRAVKSQLFTTQAKRAVVISIPGEVGISQCTRF